ncbi:MAG: dethiobiotin synthase [Fibrobacteres bacterium]|nr:dethiobiotin synthase [Fibrobacterota bacterium]
MAKAIFITGTGTDVGKTALSLAVLLWARQKGLRAAYHKPIQSGTYAFGLPPREGGMPQASGLPQAGRLQQAGGLPQAGKLPQAGGDAEWILAMAGGGISTHVTYRLRMPASPHLAAEAEGVTIDMGRIRGEIESLHSGHDLVVVEGSGGPAVPVNRQGATLAHLAAEMGLPSLLACSPGLGTLHHTLSTLAFLRTLSAPVAGFAFCHREAAPSALAEDNRATLQSLTRLPWFGALPFSEPLARCEGPTPAEAAAWYAPLTPSLEAWWKPE